SDVGPRPHLAGVVDGRGAAVWSAERAKIAHDAALPQEGMGTAHTDDLACVIHVVGSAPAQVLHEVIFAVGVGVAEPAIGRAVAVRILRRDEEGADVARTDDLACVVDGESTAESYAERAEVGHDAVLPEESMSTPVGDEGRRSDDLAVSVNVVGLAPVAAERAQVGNRIAGNPSVLERFDAESRGRRMTVGRLPTG